MARSVAASARATLATPAICVLFLAALSVPLSAPLSAPLAGEEETATEEVATEDAEADEAPEELAYSRNGGYVGAGGTTAAENFSGGGSYDDAASILFRAGYRGLPYLAVDFLGEVLTEFDSESDPDVDGYAVTVGFRLLLPLGRLEPYLGAGLGVLSIDPDGASREDDFAFRSAAGFDFYLTPHWALFAEAAYMLPTGDVDDFEYSTYGGGFLFRF